MKILVMLFVLGTSAEFCSSEGACEVQMMQLFLGDADSKPTKANEDAWLHENEDNWPHDESEVARLEEKPFMQKARELFVKPAIEASGEVVRTTPRKENLGKVYMYPSPKGNSPEDLVSCFKKKYPGLSPFKEDAMYEKPGPGLTADITEWFVHKQALISELRTEDPKQAKFFLANAMPILSWVTGHCNGMSHEDRQEYWSSTLSSSSWYERKGGADHLFVCSSYVCGGGYGKGKVMWFSDNKPPSIGPVSNELSKLVKPMWYLTQERRVQRTGLQDLDRIVVVPYVANNNLVSSSASSPKTTWMTFYGNTHRHGAVRQALGKVDFPELVMNDYTKTRGNEGWDTYTNAMTSSSLCLVPSGDTPASRRLFDAMLAGCVPVLIDTEKFDRPFDKKVPYKEFSVVIRADKWVEDPNGEISKLHKHLESSEIEAKRKQMKKYVPFIDWRHGDVVLRNVIREVTERS